MIQKYFFRKEIKGDLPIQLESFWWDIWCNNQQRISNLKLVLTSSSLQIHKRDRKRIGLKSYMSDHSVKLDTLKSVLMILGLESSLSTNVVVHSNDIKQLINDQDLLNRLDKIFEQGKLGNNTVVDKKQALGLVNSVLNMWSGGNLVKITKSRKQFLNDNGKKSDSYNYILSNKFEASMQKQFSNSYIKDIFNWM